MVKWKESKKYSHLYSRLKDIFDNIETRIDEQGFYIEEHKPNKKAITEMAGILMEEGINDIYDMLGFIMQVSRGRANPEIIEKTLNKIIMQKRIDESKGEMGC